MIPQLQCCPTAEPQLRRNQRLPTDISTNTKSPTAQSRITVMASPELPSFETEATKPQPTALRTFASFLINNKKWWITPIVLMLLLLGALVLLGGSGVAPFIYSLF